MQNCDYQYKDIISSLRNVGIREGDSIFIHSNLGFFGRLENAENSDDYGNNFKNAIFEVIEKTGTLIVPTFSYTFCNNEKFDIKHTPGVCGIFSEHIRKDENAIRSNDPNFSICSIGKNAKFFTENCSSHSFGDNSFWERFLMKRGKICNFNFDSTSTLCHYIEKQINVNYRFDKKFHGQLKIGNNLVKKEFIHFVYDKTKPQHAPNFEKFHKKAIELKKVKLSDLGRGQITSISSLDTINIIKNEMKINPNFLINGKV